MATAEWTVLEKLLLSQAVYKYGEDNWFQIARNLKHHSLLDRPSDYFNQKVCFKSWRVFIICYLCCLLELLIAILFND
jgi:bromodomain-containing protein 8